MRHCSNIKIEPLQLNEQSLSESEVKEDDNETEHTSTATPHPIEAKKKKKKRKKKSGKHTTNRRSSEDNADVSGCGGDHRKCVFRFVNIICSQRHQIDEISRTVREVDKLFGQTTILPVKSTNSHKATVLHSLLTVQHKNLNPSYEMKRMFGSRVVQAEQYAFGIFQLIVVARKTKFHFLLVETKDVMLVDHVRSSQLGWSRRKTIGHHYRN